MTDLNHYANANARIYLKNEGTKSIYDINFPGRTRNLMSGDIAVGDQEEWTFPLYDVYGMISRGLWNIYAYTSDGSKWEIYCSSLRQAQHG